MFSSLEALDAQEALDAIPVIRQGAFQPKAKPRARKAGGANVASASIPSKKLTEESSKGFAPKVDGGLASTAARQLDVPLLSTRADSALPVGMDHSNGITDTAAAHCTDVASAAEEQVSKERAVRNDEDADIRGQRRNFNEPRQEAALAGVTVPTDIISNRLESPSLKSPKTVDLETLVMSSILGSHDAENEEFLNAEQNADGVGYQKQENNGAKIASVQETDGVGYQKQENNGAKIASVQETDGVGYQKQEKNGAKIASVQETVLETDRQDNEKNVDRVVTQKRKRSCVKIALPEETLLETVVDNSTQSCLQVDAHQLNSNASKPIEPVKSKRNRRQSHVQQENTESDLSKKTTKKPATEVSKPRKERFSAFAAATSVENQPDAELALTRDGVSEPAACVEEGQKKKRLKKSTFRKKKVEKRAMNPMDPDLDPKKLTMKDIIRLAEAKERMSKEGTAKRSKDSSEKASSIGEAEQEQQNERASFAPQVQFIDGRIVINQESLTVSAHPVNDIRQYTRVEETHSKLNYHSYMKRTPKKVWTKEDTELFYKALGEFGTNFALMQHLFPGRTRRQIFLKFKKEERAFPSRLAEAMTKKSSENLQFMEVISRLNLLPDEARESCLHEHPTVSSETTSMREEHEGSISASMEDAASMKVEKPEADGLGLKMDESMSKSSNLQEKMNDWKEEINDANKVGSDFESARSLMLAGACDSLKKNSSPPRKSLFSYQNLSSKPSKSLFSYQDN